MNVPPPPFAVRSDFTAPYLDGVYLAVNAIPDAYLVYNAHDCGYYKAERIAANHDLTSDLLRWESMNRVVRTHIDSREYIMGTEDKLSMKVRQVVARYAPPLMLVAHSSVVAAIAGDDPAVLEDLRAGTRTTIVEVPTRGLGGDWVSGYSDALTAVAGGLRLAGATSDAVWLVGHQMIRGEADQRANAAALGDLVRALGHTPGPVLLDGTPFAALARLPPPRVVISLTGSGRAGALIARRYGAQHVTLPLPIGIAGTVAWLEEAGRALGADAAARAVIDRHLGRLVPELEWILPRYFIGRPAFVFADRLLLGPLVLALEELGCGIAGVGCLSTGERGAPSPAALGLDPARHPLVPLDVASLRARLAGAARARQDPPLVLGNSLVGQIAGDLPLAFVEIGFPSATHHALVPRPLLGFDGVRTLVERAINAIGQRDRARAR